MELAMTNIGSVAPNYPLAAYASAANTSEPDASTVASTPPAPEPAKDAPDTDNDVDTQVAANPTPTNANENVPATYTAVASASASNIRGTNINTVA
jgi:hypothetical protein